MNEADQSDQAPLKPSDAKAQQKAHMSFINSVNVPNKPDHDLRPLIAALTCIIVVAIALGVYALAFHHKSPPKTAKSSISKSQTSSSSALPAPSQATQSYTSSTYNLSFNYPANWSVVNDTNGLLSVTSLPTSLVNANNQSVIGEVIMTIQPQGQLPASFSAGTDLAVLNSQLISYANPTTSQSAQTYISYVQYSSTNTKGGLDGIYLTGNYGYTQPQAIPSSDVASIDPLVTVTFIKCGNEACTSNLTPLTISSSSWSKATTEPFVLKMLESLTFQ